MTHPRRDGSSIQQSRRMTSLRMLARRVRVLLSVGAYAPRSDAPAALSGSFLRRRTRSRAAIAGSLAWAAGAALLFRADLHRGSWLAVYALALTPIVICMLSRRQTHAISAAEAEAIAWEDTGGSGATAASDRGRRATRSLRPRPSMKPATI